MSDEGAIVTMRKALWKPTRRVRRVRAKGDWRVRMIFFFVTAAVISFFVWIFLALDPFQTSNPFLKEVTIGETVIGGWSYGGTDSAGELRFFNGYETLPLPGDTKTFAADGEYVTLDGHTASTLTFEPAVESEVFGPTTWFWIACVGAAIIVAISARTKGSSRRKGPGARFRSPSPRK